MGCPEFVVMISTVPGLRPMMVSRLALIEPDVLVVKRLKESAAMNVSASGGA
jgi:hypothetical protein